MINEGSMAFAGTMEEFDNHLAPNSLIVSMLNPPLLSELMNMEGIQHVELLTDNRFRIHYTDAQQVMDSLIDKSSAHRWHICELMQEKSSLETVFSMISRKKTA